MRSTQQTLPLVSPELGTSTDHWNTPSWIVDRVEVVLRKIDLDPCSNIYSKVPAVTHWTIEDNGDRDWPACRVFVNGPYSAPDWWIARAADCFARGGHVVALPKLDPSTAWWRHTESAAAMCLLGKRVRFDRPGVNKSKPPNFPSALILWTDDLEMRARFARTFSDVGQVWTR